MFQSAATGKICMEARYLPKHPVQGDVNCYVDELLLGPLTAEYRPLFTRGTRAQSCFVRDGILYVDLSDALISESDGASEIGQGMDLDTPAVEVHVAVGRLGERVNHAQGGGFAAAAATDQHEKFAPVDGEVQFADGGVAVVVFADVFEFDQRS